VGKKIVLPLLDELARRDPGKPGADRAPKKKPSIDVARSRLGGRAQDAGAPPPGVAPGTVVVLPRDASVGVVVYANAREAHVLFERSRLKRLAPEDLAAHDGEPPGDLGKVAADARVFWMLSEGQPVRYADDGGSLRDGKLVEKCRYGALVLRDDGGIVAVGFRKLWPVATAGDA
jgi:hypothetical protein